MRMKKNILLILVLGLYFPIFLFSLSYCSRPVDDKAVNPAVLKNTGNPAEDDSSDNKMIEDKLRFDDILGNWKLVFKGDFGYQFRFYRSYKSLVTLYLGNQALLFKGVYAIDKNIIRINIYEMKRENAISQINFSRGFVQAKSSFFVFKAEITKKNNKKVLTLYPQQIKIDGSDSDGYFEPQIKLKYLGK